MKSLIAHLTGLPPFKKPLAAVSHALLACSFLTGCVINLDWQTGNGVAVTETRHLPAFSRIEMDAPVRVTVKSGDSYAAYVTGDENLVAYLETEAFGGTLTISQSYLVDPVVEPRITVIVPDLRALEHNGMGVVEILEDGEFGNLALTLNGGGEILFSGTATNLKATINGSGRIYAEGYADHLQAVMRGHGEISAEYLLAGGAEVDLSGSGNVYLDLDYGSELFVNLSGSGKGEWWGAPAKVDYRLSGTGKVLEHRGLPKKTANTTAKISADKPDQTAPKGAGLRK
jgi:hypothetical protein